MELNAGNWLIILVGILLCFTGILYKKVFEAILGFLIGAWLTLCIMIVMALQAGATIFMVLASLQTEEGQKVLLFAMVCGVILAVLSVVFERIIAVLRAFCGAFFLVCLFFIIVFAGAAEAIYFLLAFVVAFLWAYLMWKYRDYPFIVESAFIGALMIYHVGYAEALASSANSFYGSNSSTSFSGYVVLTVVTAAAGIYVQIRILKRLEKKNGVVEGNGGDTNRKKWDLGKYFPDSNIKKETVWDVRYYEKYLVMIPILAFGIIPFWRQLTASQPFYHFLYCMECILTGAFVGGMIYFTIYYEKKMALLYQVLYLCWIPVMVYRAMRDGYSLFSVYFIGPLIRKAVVYVIIWGIFILIDSILKNIKWKLCASCIVAGIMLAGGIEWFVDSTWYYQMWGDILCKWIGLGGILAVLMNARKQPVGRRCMKCGTKRITSDYFCRNCGSVCIGGRKKRLDERE